MTDWRIEARPFVLPKEGATLAECEDAVGLNEESWAYAVADGATEAFDARSWARRLAENWVRAVPAPVTVEEFGPWAARQGELLRSSWEGRALPWYAEEKRRAGSFATFVGLSFEAGGAGLGWRAVSLGDFCLVQRRGDALVAALPVARHDHFNSCPPLVPSSDALQRAVLARAVTRAGTAERGDVFLLFSDAVAAWYLEAFARGRRQLAEFDSSLAASENEALAELLRREQRENRMRDDDVAVIRLRVARAGDGV